MTLLISPITQGGSVLGNKCEEGVLGDPVEFSLDSVYNMPIQHASSAR